MIDHLVLSATLRAETSPATQTLPGIAPEHLSVRVSLPQSGNTITVPSDCTTILVRADGNGPETHILRRIDRSVVSMLRSTSDVCSLDRGTYILQSEHRAAEVLQFEVSRASLSAFCKANPVAGVRHVRIPAVVRDTTLHLLSRTIRPLVSESSSLSSTFSEYFLLAFFAHLAENYGVHHVEGEAAMGGLSPKNRRMVEQRIREYPTLEITAESLAEACHLSPRHFARAFQQSFGIPFHRLLRDLRLNLAKRLLTETALSLQEISAHMGYADQATFTESFKRDAGTPPGRYRRQFSSGDNLLTNDTSFADGGEFTSHQKMILPLAPRRAVAV